MLSLTFQGLFSQDPILQDSTSFKNGISKPTTLATHPFGILFYTLPHNFKYQADRTSSLDLQLSSGNIWGQPVTAYIPTNADDRARMKDIAFFSRIAFFDPENSPSESYTFEYDGVVKDLRIALNIPLAKKQELLVTARAFMLTDGSFPYATITGDQFIESFHSNIAGGEDPFGRRVLGLDKAGIKYTDRDGNSLHISKDQFVFSGIETAYYYYPELLREKNIHLNFGAHLGTNLSKYNTSVDLGMSMAGVKTYRFSKNRSILVGLGLNLLKKDMISFVNDQTDLGTSSFFGSLETQIEFTRRNRNGGHHSLGINYRIQTPYNQKKEEDYYVPFNPDRIKRWHEAARHLYKYPSYWSLVYSFTKKAEFSIYIQQDLLVNNAPDIQTGIKFALPILNF
ncbi:hypothetical protein ACFQ1M_17795 [Sungkyunkwania multivorans]|uniref:Uncharacterized protein n=1 Tax=Sungkyunkwania multivorans TaxID=1173618 RepID=A0ABW3D3K9_9FLAO